MKAKFSFRSFFRSNKSRSRPSSVTASSPSPSSSSDKETPKSVLPSNACHWTNNNDITESFNIFDRNGDGKISLHELQILFHRLGGSPPTQEELIQILSEAELDGDGCISLNEFGALSSSLGPAEAHEMRDAFEYFDRDGDGRISAEELLGVFLALGDEGCTLADCQRMIEGVDVEGKGFVSFEDFARMMQLQRQN